MDLNEDKMREGIGKALAGLPVSALQRSRMGAGSDDVDGPRAYLRALAPGGWIVPTWPADCGGRGLDTATSPVVRSVLAEFDRPDLYPFMVGLYLVGPTLLRHGDQRQRTRWLPRIADGTEIWCQMFSEPSAGSDLANVSTRAIRMTDGWHLSGQKVWTSRGSYADWGLCLARTDPDVPKHEGMTMFAVKMDRPGVDVRPLTQMNGDQHFSEVFLDDVLVPDEDRVDEPGRGWAVAMTVLVHERSGMQSSGGRPQGARERPIVPDWLRDLSERNLLHDPVICDRAVQVMILERVNHLTQARARARRTPGAEGSGTKLRTAEVFKKRSELIKDAQGLAGMLDSSIGHVDWLTAPSMSIRGGTDEIQRNIIGERVLGLDQEPRVDRDRPWSQTRVSG